MFRKSSRCDTAFCVEVDTAWRKSSYSYDLNCVEVAPANDVVGVRDSKDPDSPVLGFSDTAWSVFTSSLRP